MPPSHEIAAHTLFTADPLDLASLELQLYIIPLPSHLWRAMSLRVWDSETLLHTFSTLVIDCLSLRQRLIIAQSWFQRGVETGALKQYLRGRIRQQLSAGNKILEVVLFSMIQYRHSLHFSYEQVKVNASSIATTRHEYSTLGVSHPDLGNIDK